MGISNNHIFAIQNDGKIKCWGMNGNYQLGLEDGTNNNANPNIKENTKIINPKKIYCLGNATFVLYEDGTVKGVGTHTGFNGATYSPKLIDIPIVSVENISGTGGLYYTLKNGTIKACGRNTEGQLGLGDNTNRLTIVDLPLTNVKCIYAGDNYAMALMNDGTVKACGNNADGQLGLGDKNNRNLWTDVPITGVKDICCGRRTTHFLMNDKTVKVCGNNGTGCYGDSITASDSPVSLTNLSNIKKVFANFNSTVFLLEDNTVRTCGYNNKGECGTGNNTMVQKATDIGLKNVKWVETMIQTTLFLFEDGTMKGCGDNTLGQLGIGNINSPIYSITSIPITNVKTISNYDIFSINKYLLQAMNNKIYVVNNNLLTELTGAINETLFINSGMNSLNLNLTNDMINQLGKFKVLKYTDLSTLQNININGNYKQQIYKIVPNSKLLMYTDDITKTKVFASSKTTEIYKPYDKLGNEFEIHAYK